jgi:hypothetical protein
MTMTPHLSRLRGLSLGVLLCLLLAPGRAEDIDIYAEPNIASELPNVLFILDSSANWSTDIPAPTCFFKDNGVVTTNGPKASNPGQEQGKKMAIEKCALYNVIDALPVASGSGYNVNNDALFNVGYMLLTVVGQRRISAQGPHPVDDQQQSGLKTLIRASTKATRARTPISRRPCTSRTCTTRAWRRIRGSLHPSAIRRRSTATTTTARRAPRARATT